jgi:hypothetical protein
MGPSRPAAPPRLGAMEDQLLDDGAQGFHAATQRHPRLHALGSSVAQHDAGAHAQEEQRHVAVGHVDARSRLDDALANAPFPLSRRDKIKGSVFMVKTSGSGQKLDTLSVSAK